MKEYESERIRNEHKRKWDKLRKDGKGVIYFNADLLQMNV